MDNRIRTLVENCVKLRQRSLFVIVGDKGRDQVTCPALQALACIISGGKHRSDLLMLVVCPQRCRGAALMPCDSGRHASAAVCRAGPESVPGYCMPLALLYAGLMPR